MKRRDESESELFAKERLEGVLAVALERIVPDGTPGKFPDYAFDTQTGHAAVEVKEMSSHDWRMMQDGLAKNGYGRATDEVQKHWTVALDSQTLAQRLGDGRRAPAKVKGLVDDLIPDLALLEARGITTTRGDLPTDPDGQQAWWRIARRTKGAICLASDANPGAGLLAGVFIAGSYGYVRTARPDTLAGRIDEWFAAGHGSNLIASLDRPEYAEGHGVLVFDSLEPEWHSAQESDEFLPSQPLAMPSKVDVLWALLGACTLRYSRDVGWSEYRSVP